MDDSYDLVVSYRTKDHPEWFSIWYFRPHELAEAITRFLVLIDLGRDARIEYLPTR